MLKGCLFSFKCGHSQPGFHLLITLRAVGVVRDFRDF